ncbi:helix-turn-helix transcriptional regulator [Planotetraspora kaengkrachanensis]|uniref:Transcriptional regulator n=1 Tax=Planotetraspora kaengkrachanensis TaxID=575193 RepID=A0A8J3Q1M3_9ACTN|nr:helix-turn-helix transcriptional regulator [Planotetraspora kaengkrachanensis]GIG84948.1 transcriptional regulator [Planotetraspora kaengkrachanensis]
MDRLVGLGDFLRSRRARLNPEDVGMEGVGRRRVPGLRREELARLAGVSVDYYARLEQGRSKNASPVVLDALASALQLDQTERDHLFALAGPIIVPVQGAEGAWQRVSPLTYELLDALKADVPACVFSHCLDILAANQPFRALHMWHDDRPARDNSLPRFFFLDPNSRTLYLDWEHVATDVTAMLHFAHGRHPGDPRLNELIGELLENEDFRELWAAHHVYERASGTIAFHHPIVGEFSLHYQLLRLPGDPEQFLFVCTAAQGSLSASALERLAKWAHNTAPSFP